VPQISCEWRDHANHEHENPNSIAVDAIAIKQANGEPRVRLLWVILPDILQRPLSSADDHAASKTESDCRMADGHWDKMNKRCEEKKT
jgi:hypothetical protein